MLWYELKKPNTISGHNVSENGTDNDCANQRDDPDNECSEETVQHGEGQQGAEHRSSSSESPVSNPAYRSSGDEDCDSNWEGDGAGKTNNQMGQCLRKGTRMRRQFDPTYMCYERGFSLSCR